jgi:RHS repeat-associated protein
MPVDIPTGAVRLYFQDAVVPGRVELVWDRLYSTTLLTRPPTALGLGWTCRYLAALTRSSEGFQFLTPDGDLEEFADRDGTVDSGGVVRRLGTFEEIFRANERYIVQRWDPEGGDAWRYCFTAGEPDRPWRLQSIEAPNGQGVDLSWDQQGRLAGVRQRLERRSLIITYGLQGFVDKVLFVAPGGEQQLLVRYEYDARGRQLAAYDAAGLANRYEYDDEGRLSREIVKDGGVFTYRYDSSGRCVKTSGLDGYGEKRLRFLDAINFTEVTDSYGQTSRFQYAASGQIVLEIDPLGGERRSEYDEHDRLVATTDRTGAVTRFAYDDQGNRAVITDALSHSQVMSFDRHHRAVSFADPLGNVWHHAYDESNRLIGTRDPLNGRWSFGYDADGNLVEVENPVGARRRLQYEHGVLTASIDSLGHITRFRHDASGRVTERTDPLGEVTRFRYDVLGRPVEVTLPTGASVRLEFDAAGNLTGYTDPNGHSTRYRYGPCARLLERIDPLGRQLRYEWGNEAGRLDRVVNEAGATYTFFRDAGGRAIREQSFDGVERHFTYDADGYVVRYVNANGEAIDIERDALHRIVGQRLPDGNKVTYRYDPAGDLVAADTSDSKVTFERNAVGRVVREVQGSHWVSSRYDANGNLTNTVTSLGHTVDYALDANGFVSRLSTSRDQALVFTHDAYGRETTRRTSGGVLVKQRYDRLRRLVEQTVTADRATDGSAWVPPGPRGIVQRSYTYDQRSSVASITDTRAGRIDYTYDPAEQLLNAVRQVGASEAFTYDVAGNLTRIEAPDESVDGAALVYGPGNRLVQCGDTRYEYDAEGQRIRKIENANDDQPRVWEYVWNALGCLTAVKRPDGDTWRYTYDALARRVEKIGPDSRRQFLWDRDVQIHEFEAGESLSAWVFDRYSFAPLATVQRGRLYSAVNDHLGTPKELIDSAGTVAWSGALKVWGDDLTRVRASATVDCQIRFQGQWRDEESGLHYNRHRYYDPGVGRFISQDPVRLIGGANFYNLSPNPVSWLDPLGLSETWYRSMSERDWNTFQETGKMPPSNKETMVSPTAGYAGSYTGTRGSESVLVKITVKDGTTDALLKIGVRNEGPLIQEAHGELPLVSSVKNWKENNAFFKEEKKQINIGLGKGKALDIFNENIEEKEKLDKSKC